MARYWNGPRCPLVQHATRLLMRVAPDSSRVYGIGGDPVALADARTSAADARELLVLRMAELEARTVNA